MSFKHDSLKRKFSAMRLAGQCFKCHSTKHVMKDCLRAIKEKPVVTSVCSLVLEDSSHLPFASGGVSFVVDFEEAP